MSMVQEQADIVAARPKIAARGVNVHYGAKQALFDVGIDIAAHAVTALIGP